MSVQRSRARIAACIGILNGDRDPRFGAINESMTSISFAVSTSNYHTMASLLEMLPTLRRAAPRLTRRYFTCRQCQQSSSRPNLRNDQKASPRSPFSRSFGSSSLRSSAASSDSMVPKLQTASPLSSLSETLRSSQTRARFFPEVSDKVVAYWLLGSAASVFGIVVFGGLTRLTESGYVCAI